MHGNNIRKLPVQLSLSQTSKISCFSFYLYLLCFFFYKTREKEGITGFVGEGLAPVGERRWQGRG
jgi:hypothetical protein